MKELQVENGNYTRIVNVVIEKLLPIPFNGCELALALFIIRKTWGYQKKEDQISLSQMELALERTRPTVVKALKNLQLVNILILVKKGTSISSSSVWRFNKYYHTWKLVNTRKLVKGNTIQLVKTRIHTKETTKERSTDDKSSLLTKKTKHMRTYNENEHTGDDLPDLDLDTGQVAKPLKKTKESKNKVALSVQSYFIGKAYENTGTQPTPSSKGYFLILEAMNKSKLDTPLLKRRIDDWFASGQPEEKLVQITHCFSNYSINDWKVKNSIR
jgi:phage replication O-like protein O